MNWDEIKIRKIKIMKPNNKERQRIAHETLKIISEREYKIEDKTIDLFTEINYSKQHTKTYSPEELEELISIEKIGNESQSIISCENITSFKAIKKLGNNENVCVLNFASAKNPGGGFLGGASAQEESLARASSLYDSLSNDMTMYNYNRSRETLLYSDYMIYSPKVIFWMDDAGEKRAKPLIADVITSPAPNKGAILQNNRKQDMQNINAVFEKRIHKVLALAHTQKVEHLILGAWGCGVFRNDPNDVAAMFEKVISIKFPNHFKQIIFAVYDSSETKNTFKTFEKVFKELFSKRNRLHR
jgi:uncharacterized protein (TIGR02452 family)